MWREGEREENISREPKRGEAKFNLLKMGENFTGLNTVGKEPKKTKG